MKASRYIVVFIMFIVWLSNTIPRANAQWNFSIAYDQEYNDNPFRLPQEQPSWISSLQFGAEKSLSNFSLGYYGNFSYFNSILDRNYYWHQLAIWGGSDTTSWGMYGEQRMNKSQYNLYDYFEANGYLQHRLFVRGIKITFNSSLNINQYKELPDLNNWIVNTSFQAHRSFATRTTLMGGLNISYKSYFTTHINESYDSSPDQFYMGETFYGRGHGRGGRGYLSSASYDNFASSSSVSQLGFWARIAQSLTRTTGVAAQFQSRKLLTGSNRFVSGISYSYNQESQLFDDPMSYESNSLGIEITQLLPFETILKLAGYYTTKNYSAQGIYLDAENYDESILREDQYQTMWLNLRKNIGINFANGGGIVLNFHYQWVNSQSNSYWYDYNNHQASLQLQFEF